MAFQVVTVNQKVIKLDKRYKKWHWAGEQQMRQDFIYQACKKNILSNCATDD